LRLIGFSVEDGGGGEAGEEVLGEDGREHGVVLFEVEGEGEGALQGTSAVAGRFEQAEDGATAEDLAGAGSEVDVDVLLELLGELRKGLDGPGGGVEVALMHLARCGVRVQVEVIDVATKAGDGFEQERGVGVAGGEAAAAERVDVAPGGAGAGSLSSAWHGNAPSYEESSWSRRDV
jgi:hypothetical protein